MNMIDTIDARREVRIAIARAKSMVEKIDEGLPLGESFKLLIRLHNELTDLEDFRNP